MSCIIVSFFPSFFFLHHYRLKWATFAVDGIFFSGEEWRIAIESYFKSSNKLKDKLRKLNEPHLEAALRLIFCRLRLNCNRERERETFQWIQNWGGITAQVSAKILCSLKGFCLAWEFNYVCIKWVKVLNWFHFLCSPGLTDEEIDLAFQQSGTSTDEPQSPGPSTHPVPAQPPHPLVHGKCRYLENTCFQLLSAVIPAALHRFVCHILDFSSTDGILFVRIRHQTLFECTWWLLMPVTRSCYTRKMR